MLKSVFEFIIAFAENHFETIINNCRHQSDGSTATKTINVDSTSLVLRFIDQLVQLTCSTLDPLLLSRILVVWNKMISIPSLKIFVITQSSQQCIQLSMHILQVCLITTNREHMYDCMTELINDLQCSLYVDAFILHMMKPIITASKTNHLSIDKVSML